MPPARSGARSESGDDEQEGKPEHQGGQRNGDRDERIALAEQVDDDLQGVEREERRDRVLAEDEGDGEDRRRQDPTSDVRDDDLEDRPR